MDRNGDELSQRENSKIGNLLKVRYLKFSWIMLDPNDNKTKQTLLWMHREF